MPGNKPLSPEPDNFPPADPALLAGVWVTSYAPLIMIGQVEKPRLGADYVPAAALATFTFGASNSVALQVTLNKGGRLGRKISFEGQFNLRRNSTRRVIDGFVILRNPQLGIRNTVYVVLRAHDELAFLLTQGVRTGSAGGTSRSIEEIQAALVQGVLKRVPHDLVVEPPSRP